ncbi:claudin-like protein ZF-A89 [Osmerus mordax]|uniref:claudin-like protein ZF-A89 n=1 Tax=Osmerus mordax TaxID=8014 RepID=UPI00350F2D9D
MASIGLQMLGSVLGLFGWIGVILVCGMPMWKVTAFIGNNIMTAQTIWEGIWMSCVVQSTGQMQCKVYDSMLALSSDLQTVQSLVVVSILTGFVGLLMAFVSSMCTNFIVEEAAKTKAMVMARVALVISGILCFIPVSWMASIIIRDFYNPMLIDAQRRELGASLYMGWAAGIMLVVGGGLLPHNEDKAPSVKYLLAKSSGGHSKQGSVGSDSTPTKT